jgi:hypothetical protein
LNGKSGHGRLNVAISVKANFWRLAIPNEWRSPLAKSLNVF